MKLGITRRVSTFVSFWRNNSYNADWFQFYR